jgi:glutaredoxin
MRRSTLAPFLCCVLLAASGCGVVKDAAQRALGRVLGDAASGLFGSADEESDAAEGNDGGVLSIAADEDAVDDVVERAGDDGGEGFFKIVEPNGTVRFVSNLSQLSAADRSKAERLALAPSKRGKDARRPAAPSRRAEATRDAAPPAALAPSRPSSGDHEVVVYTTSWCGWCKKTIAWLDSKGVGYVNKDVEADPEAAAEMREHVGGDSGVPVVVIDGEVIRGFSAAKMESLLL